MSRSKKDQPGGHKTKYWVSANNIGRFKRNCRKSSRAKAKDDLRNAKEPAHVYPIEREYFD